MGGGWAFGKRVGSGVGVGGWEWGGEAGDGVVVDKVRRLHVQGMIFNKGWCKGRMGRL